MIATHQSADFPPYELLHDWEHRAAGKTHRLERLYHQTQARSWDPRAVLDELEAKHGGIHVPEDKREAMGHVFTVILWGELAAWNIAADLARALPDVDAKMAATGQVFDEARHFTVMRDYFQRAKIELPPMNPFGRRMLVKILETESVLEKLYGMQLLVENLALAIFKQVAASGIEPVLTDLLAYVERDESRHVALGVIYLPKLLAQASAVERARNWAFNMELFFLTIGGGQLLDPHFKALGVDHRQLGATAQRLHEQVLRQMSEDSGLKPGQRVRGSYGLSVRQRQWMLDFLHPAGPTSPAVTRARKVVNRATRTVAGWMS
jgi:ribonucleotide reductase beta subunit family protein with ferritin-like domain